MDAFRLDSVAPGLAESFRRAPSNKRRQAAQVACEQAVAAAGLTASVVSEALSVLRGAAAPEASLLDRLESLAARFDDEYVELDEDTGQKQQATVFQ
jgi:hypothetical protein